MRVTYGYQVKSADDRMLAIALQSLGNFSKISTPGAFLVDQIPACKHDFGSADDDEFKIMCSTILAKMDAWIRVLGQGPYPTSSVHGFMLGPLPMEQNKHSERH